jgi:hypothetical protein
VSRPLADALSKLLKSDNGLASSQFTVAQRCALEEFSRKTQAVRLITQGRGTLYRVFERAVAVAHLKQMRPMQSEDLSAALPLRATNLALYRNSKGAAAGHAVQYLLFKSINADTRWQNEQGHTMDLPTLTHLHGAAALAVQTQDGWCTDSPLWLVENQALFDDLRWLPADASGTVCYYAGQISGGLLDWLSLRARAPRVILFPDYDGIGLQNFARLRERLCNNCEFWLMPNWAELLHRHGNREIWLNNLANFQDAVARLQTQAMSPMLEELCRSMQVSGLALEQEAVFLNFDE